MQVWQACSLRRGGSRAAVVARASAGARVGYTLAHQKGQVALRQPGSLSSAAGIRQVTESGQGPGAGERLGSGGLLPHHGRWLSPARVIVGRLMARR
jgi:hypothetical protein